MNKGIIQSKGTLPESKESYSPKETAAIRKAIMQSVLSESYNIFSSRHGKVDMNDTETVKMITDAYYRNCVEKDIIPTFEGLCGALGLGRTWFYEYLRKNPKSKTTQYLEGVRTAFADIKQQLAMKNVTNPVMTIFILKNSNLGYTDKTEVDMRASSAYEQYNTDSTDEVRRKYIESLETDILFPEESEKTD